jgi:hypothetical protein
LREFLARPPWAERPRRNASPMALLKDKVTTQTRTIADLEEKLAAAEQRDGSLFDLHQDRAEDIANVIVGTVPGKAAAIAKAITAKLRERRAPAG